MTEPVATPVETTRGDAVFRAAVMAGIASADAGRTISLDKVRDWLLSWGKAGELPTPN